MISLRDVHKQYPTRLGPVDVLRGVNLTIAKGDKVGILGRNGAGKSTLVRLMSGAERATSGHIKRGMSISWPLAFGGAFQSSLTGLDNLKFICRIYGVDYREKVDYVQDFAELGTYFREPVRNYSSGMRSRLAFAISMSIEFDCFLIDEVISVGDARFHDKCQRELFEKRNDRSYVIVSHEAHNIRDHCHSVAVLTNGKLTLFEDVDTAYAHYQEHC
jgi:capsular polysaccharide transport system ATP-binding protein